MRKKIRLFRIFNFFSFSVLFSSLIEYLQNLLSIKKIKFKGKEIKFYVSSGAAANGQITLWGLKK